MRGILRDGRVIFKTLINSARKSGPIALFLDLFGISSVFSFDALLNIAYCTLRLTEIRHFDKSTGSIIRREKERLGNMFCTTNWGQSRRLADPAFRPAINDSGRHPLCIIRLLVELKTTENRLERWYRNGS